VAQNIMSALYKGVGGWVNGVGGALRLPFRHDGTSCCAKGAVNGPQATRTTRQSKPSDNSHGRLGAASHQCHLIKTRQALLLCF